MVLISGYFVTSLFFINKTSASGEQVDIYASITEQADEIIIAAYRMEASAQSYIMTHTKDFHDHFESHKCDLGQSFKELKSHCLDISLASEHLVMLDRLIQKRKTEVNHLMHSDSIHQANNSGFSKGDLNLAVQSSIGTMDSISDILSDIRFISAKNRDENRAEVVVSVRNTMFMLSVFGIVMIAIVIISFNKMKTEILANEEKAREIQEINRELSLVNENLENFAYVASHDLNEPLRKIRTFGELIADEFKNESPDDELIRAHINRMQVASERMQLLIEDLLSYSRVTRKYDENEVIDLNEVLEDTISDLQIAIKDNNAQIVLDNLPVQLRADRIQMRQLFQNLISNAIKFCHSERSPKVEVTANKISQQEAIEIGMELPIFESYWKINVVDNGIGFDNQYAETIFAVFKRLHGRSDYEGTGIGLSICKKIVEQHKGYIKAHGIEGEGSSFIILLPAIEENKSNAKKIRG
jgi:signal transduction histidine kinase